jgi:hypothetical protein
MKPPLPSAGLRVYMPRVGKDFKQGGLLIVWLPVRWPHVKGSCVANGWRRGCSRRPYALRASRHAGLSPLDRCAIRSSTNECAAPCVAN